MKTIERYLYIAAIAVIIAGGLWLRAHLIDEGRNAVHAEDARLAGERLKSNIAQQEYDNETSGQIIGGLRDQLAAFTARRAADAAPNPVRLCRPAPSPHSLPASGTTADRAQPGELARPADDSGVLGGDQPGPDVSADVRALKDAALLLGTYRQFTLDWALKQAQPVKPVQ